MSQNAQSLILIIQTNKLYLYNFSIIMRINWILGKNNNNSSFHNLIPYDFNHFTKDNRNRNVALNAKPQSI